VKPEEDRVSNIKDALDVYILQQEDDMQELKVSKTVPKDAIHFIITSAKALAPKPREMCALESAALHNQHTPVIVHMNSQVLYMNRMVKKTLTKYNNIKFHKFDVHKMVKGTVLEEWYNSSGISKTRLKLTYDSDVSRAAVLYKHGGWYLDIDVISRRNFGQEYKNLISLDYRTPDLFYKLLLRITQNFDSTFILPFVSTAFMRFEQGHQLLKDYMVLVKKRSEYHAVRIFPQLFDSIHKIFANTTSSFCIAVCISSSQGEFMNSLILDPVSHVYTQHVTKRDISICRIHGLESRKDAESSLRDEDLQEWMQLMNIMKEVVFKNGWCKSSNSENPFNFTCKGEVTCLPGNLVVSALHPLKTMEVLRKTWDDGGKDFERDTQSALGVHLHNFLGRKYRILLDPDTVGGKFLQKNCPTVVSTAGEEM
jgi:hypothetical protein